jgi:hypothetical protein
VLKEKDEKIKVVKKFISPKDAKKIQQKDNKQTEVSLIDIETVNNNKTIPEQSSKQ